MTVVDIRAKIQTLLAQPDYQPLRYDELARQLRLRPAERRQFRHVLDAMIQNGDIVRIRQNRLVLPREADLIAGHIAFHERGFAFLTPDAPPDIYIAAEDTGVALQGDKVLVRLYRGDRERAGKPSGRVIRILERAHDTVVGTLQKTKQFHYVVPDDPRFTHDIYTQPTHGAQVGDKVVVKLAEWTCRHVNPEGTIIKRLGKATAPGVDILAIIHKYHLPTEFPDAVLAEADRVPTGNLAGRLDLRDKFIITIDPDDAQDFDDAVHVEEYPEGGWKLGVHIADVSHYVRPGSALDKEAQSRGNSVYLVDRVLPMLPERLSNDVCSLRPREDRLTLSALIVFAPNLAVQRVEFAESIIHSRHRLTYRDAWARLESKYEDDVLTHELKKMWRLARRLREQRFAAGALDLDFPKTKVRLDSRGRPTRIEKVVNDISHQLIEEFMLAANEAAAHRIYTAQVPGLYRIHEDPALEKLRDFRVYAQSFGFKVGNVTHRRELQELLEFVKDKPEAYAINLALLRSLKRAQYSPQPVGHYGLARKFYTHFTSPIRRYADLVVHRTLKTLLGASSRYDLAELTKLAEHLSQTERIADEAEKESVELKQLEYFQHQLATGQLAVMDAVVCTVRNFGIFVELPETLVQGFVHISTLDDDFYHYDEARERLVGKRHHRVIQIGDKVRVRVDRVDLFKRQVDFRMVLSAGRVRDVRARAGGVSR